MWCRFAALDVAGNWSAAGTAVLTVTQPGNSPPTAIAESVTTLEDTPIAVMLAGTDPDGDTLTFTVPSLPAHGTLSGTAPNLTYTPSANFNGSDSFAFVVNDGIVDSAPATVAISITPQNDAPTISTPPTLSIAEGTSTSITASVSDVDGDVVTVAWSVVAGSDVDGGGLCTTGVQAATTTISCTDDGTYTVTATASDGHGGSAAASTTASVSNADPVVTITSAPSPVLPGSTIDLAASFTDAGSNDTHTCTVAWGDGTSAAGTITPGACAASHVYTTPGTRTVVVTVTDDDNGSGTASTTITASNRAPTASPQAVTTAEDTTASITLSGSDPDGDALSYTVVTPPAHGTLSGSGANRMYTPAANYNGPDSFNFTVADALATSAPATVSIIVSPVNDRPVAGAASLSAISGQAATVQLSGTDVDGDPLTFVIVAAPAHGTLTGSGPSFVYTSAAGFVGSDSFSYAVSDALLQSATVVVPITVSAPPTSLTLSVADDASRTTNLRPLADAVLSGGASAYVFVGPNGLGDVRRVSFQLDGTTFSSDQSVPFDFAGTSGHRPCRTCALNANPFESNLLSVGSHRITAIVIKRNGSRVTLDSTFTVANTTTHSLQVSSAADRSSSVSLSGATLSGRRYVFLGTANDAIAGLSSVTFTVDGIPISRDSTAPYDLLGSHRDGTALPLDTRLLRRGKHRITAIVTLSGGGRVVYTADFQVAN